MNTPNLPIASYTMEVLSGPERGVKFQIDPSLKQVLIGRSADCDIQIEKDAKISRKHIILQIENSEVTLTNLSAKNEVLVNDESIQQTILPDGAIIQVGTSKLIFKIHYHQQTLPMVTPPIAQRQAEAGGAFDFVARPNPTPGQPTLSNRVPPPNLSPQTTGSTYYSNRQPYATQSSRGNDNSKITFYAIVVGVGLLLTWLLSKKPAVQDSNPDLRSPAQIEKSIQELEEKKRKQIENLSKSGKHSPQFHEAQSAFIRGFRDYQQGQYIRALESFEMAEGLRHPDAHRYKLLTRNKLSQLIQYKLDLGKKYRDRNNYKLCVAELNMVMVMIENTNDILYKEAKAMRNDCDLMLKGRY